MLAFDPQEGPAQRLMKDLATLTAQPDSLRLGELSLKELFEMHQSLFEMHQSLNTLTRHVVEEMKSRQPSS